MITKYPRLITNDNIILSKDGKILMANKSHPCFSKIMARVKGRHFENIEKLFDIKENIEKYFNVEIKNGNSVYYKEQPVHNAVSERILSCLKNNLPHKPWIRFLNNLMENPTPECRAQLFDYVQRHGLPIDSNGMVYGWKAVNSKLRDIYTNKISYAPGKSPEMDRAKCNSNPDIDCAPSLHLGAVNYVLEYGRDYGDKEKNRYLLVSFNPRDVLSCPGHANWQKLRVCQLKVHREVKREKVGPLNDTYMGTPKKTKPNPPKKKVKRNKFGQFA